MVRYTLKRESVIHMLICKLQLSSPRSSLLCSLPQHKKPSFGLCSIFIAQECLESAVIVIILCLPCIITPCMKILSLLTAFLEIGSAS